MTNQAFFFNRPRVLTDLLVPHTIEDEKAFLIARRIDLRPIDYENFVSDLRVERDYIENYAKLCTQQNNIFQCLLISECGNSDGILVVPDENGTVRSAAFFED